jgi:hypothetical protein
MGRPAGGGSGQLINTVGKVNRYFTEKFKDALPSPLSSFFLFCYFAVI